MAQPHLLVTSPGDGVHFPKAGDTVYLHYTGSLDDGTVFDSSRGHEPLSFVLGQHGVIPCMEEAAGVMSTGESATLTCPPNYAYGDKQNGPIPPNSTLTFDVQLVRVQQPSFWGALFSQAQAGVPALQTLLGQMGYGPPAPPGGAGGGAPAGGIPSPFGG